MMTRLTVAVAATAIFTAMVSLGACFPEWAEECTPSDPNACPDPELFCEGYPGEDFGYCVSPTECGDGAFSCDGGACHPKVERCDGKFQCRDGLDEMGCTPCKSDEILCNEQLSGLRETCVARDARCDGTKNCAPLRIDSSDELNCDMR